jgi:hypothetical protein
LEVPTLSRLRLLTLLIACLALPVTLAACGGSDDNGSSDEDDITSAIETSATSTNPDDCEKYETQAFLEQSELESGQDAVQSCKDNAADETGNPDSVDVSDISVDGDSATASAAFTGGSLDGTTASLSLVKDGDQWKLDKITDLPVFNPDAVRTAFAAQLESSADLDDTQKACVSDQFATATDDQLKSLILGDQSILQDLFGTC